MDFSRLKARFRQFGGIKLVKEYSRMGLLLPVAGTFFKCLLTGKSYKSIYPVIEKKAIPFLREKYGPLIQPLWGKYESEVLPGCHSRTIWFCWLQGIENAPEMVLACLNSLRINLPDREIVLLDERNITDYVSLPDYILRKWRAGLIPAASYTDLIRLELLVKYGGTWIDSTVLCTGRNFPQEYFDSDLFMFRYNRPNDGRALNISTWFISSVSGNTSLLVLRDLLYAYWRDYDCLIDYYMIHRFYTMIVKAHPECVKDMPYASSYAAISLGQHWGEEYDPKKWENITSSAAFHKLSFRPSSSVAADKSNYYNEILRRYS